jgi:ketosteroid isomerase-like protein
MSEVEREIRKLEEELTQTEMRVDVDALDRIYADDIMVTAPIGICVDKPAVMTEIRLAAEKAVLGRYDKDDLKVRAYGDTAVTSYRMTAEAKVEGIEMKRQLCITNVWMKRNGQWQIVARHTASLPADTPPATETCA